MINYHETLVSALNSILPTHYELFLHSGLDTPCISYMELDNSVSTKANKLEYSRIQYQIKVRGNNIGELQDAALRPLGWTRVSSGELYDRESAMIQKILTYEALASEKFK